MNKDDLRVVKTLDAIRAAFESLLGDMDYEDITVTELCARARINKKTFYRHYADLDDLLAEFQSAMAAEFIERTKQYQLPRDMSKVTREFYLFSESKGRFYERITCTTSLHSIRDGMIDQVESEHWVRSGALDGLDNQKRAIILAYVATVSTTVYRQWIAGGKTMPLDDIIDLTCALLSGGVNAVLE